MPSWLRWPWPRRHRHPQIEQAEVEVQVSASNREQAADALEETRQLADWAREATAENRFDVRLRAALRNTAHRPQP